MWRLLLLALASLLASGVLCTWDCDRVQCEHGTCSPEEGCLCQEGWQGDKCQFCGGKVRLSESPGVITSGPGVHPPNTTCSWILDAFHKGRNGRPATNQPVIRLFVERFTAECDGSYRLYVHDGDSVDAPLLAMLSGVMYDQDYKIRRLPEIVARSGYAFLHLRSDSSVDMSDLRISYKMGGCPSLFPDRECSDNGECMNDECACDILYNGTACDTPLCPNNCAYPNGKCDRLVKVCKCGAGFKGEDCSQRSDQGFWEMVTPRDSPPLGLASHQAVIWGDLMYVLGGESYSGGGMLQEFNIRNNVWKAVYVREYQTPELRYGHSAVLHGDEVFMYGGVLAGGEVSGELWAYDINAKMWENITVNSNQCYVMCGPLKVIGHTANVVMDNAKRNEKMVVIFGYSTEYGVLNTVQEFNFGTRQWRLVKTRGFPVTGSYGHSSSWDPLSRKIYVVGGYRSAEPAGHQLTNTLYSYDPASRTWRLLNPAPLALSQHSATFLSGGLMMVFGGRGAASHQCYLAEVLSYDVACDKWGYLPILRKPFQTDLARFGHSAVTSRGLLYIYGGFDGQMKADILKFTPGRCENVTTLGECLNSRLGVKCVWTTEQTCSTITDMPGDPTASAHGGNYLGEDHTVYCGPQEGESSGPLNPSHEQLCSELQDCHSCTQTSYKCTWCGDRCTLGFCEGSNKANEANDHCEGKSTIKCSKWFNCKSCLAQEHCVWDQYGCQDIADGFKKETQTCPAACSEHSTCTECTTEECVWCESKKRCVESIAEQLIFPYGECPIWTTDTSRCPRQNQEWCRVHLTCSNCTSDPACGWCDDSSGTGMGACLSGGYSLKTAANRGRCSNKRWSFTHCKICQCNGHSRCIEDTDTCEQCDHMTQGVHCEACAPGFYGNALNGGHCRPCDCTTDGAGCHPLTGQCFCATKGVIGEQCDQCDADNSFLNGTGTCYYDLQVNAPFVFNSSEGEEGQYERFSQLNFVSTPMTDDLPMTFIITSSNNVKVNLTFKSGSGSERQANSFELGPHQPQYNFSFPVRVGKEFKIESFYVYLFDVSHPVDLEVSFTQHIQLGVQGDYYMTLMMSFVLLMLVAMMVFKAT